MSKHDASAIGLGNPMLVEVVGSDEPGGGSGETVTILEAGAAAGNESYPSTGVAERKIDITIYFGGSAAGTTSTFSTFLIDINNRQTVLPGIRSNVSIAQVTTANVGDVVDYSIPQGCRLRIDYTAPTGGTLSIKGVVLVVPDANKVASAALGEAGNVRRAVETINVDLTNDTRLDRTGVTGISTMLQDYVNRSIKDYTMKNGNNVSVPVTIEIKMPPGRFKIDNTIVFDGSQPNNPNMSDVITFSLRGAGGKSGTNFTSAPGLLQMFDFKYGRINLHDMRFYGDGTGKATLFAETGRTSRDSSSGNTQGDVFIQQSVVSNCEWYYFNRVWKASHLIDTAFYDCGIMNMVGTNPIAFEIPLRTADNVNNLMFYRVHFEGCNGGTFFKAIGGDPGLSLTHSNISFFGCHFETRFYNTTILEITHAYAIGFYNTQFTQNNTQGTELTAADVVPMFKLQDITGLVFDNCLIARQVFTLPANAANKMFDLGGRVKGLRIQGGFMDSGNNNVNQSTSHLMQSNATKPYRDTGDPWALFVDVPFVDPSVPPLNSDKHTWVNSAARNEKWGSRFSTGKDLEFGFTNNTALNYGWTTTALQITEQGALRATAYAGPKKTIAANATAKFAVANKYNLNRRGFYLVYADHNIATYCMFFSDGANVFPVTGSTNVTVAAAESSDASKLNVYLDSNKDISVKNLFAYSVNVVVTHLGT
ncbi:hypothetical protein SAMN04487896_0232 [Paenibacillus sp. ov031]|uniref:hypothetical protein n=1 Tax=Paenibacillus sp. ov031 TaxID=1761879 RepID=UPI000918D38C|nr:hypothetical protein [Paenibacillus sp. ov031]SHN52641.1 hypothetical protein SAMN04487896_0232 [Paenibacillus sp. ov031]